MEDKEPNEAWKMLLESIEEKDRQNTDLKKREIELLQKLMYSEENNKGLIHVLANKLYDKKPEEDNKETEAPNKEQD